MSIEEAKKELFKLNTEYMMHTKEEREDLKENYVKQRREIQDKLREYVKNQLEY